MALDKVAFYETQLERLTEYSRALGFTHLSYSQLIHYMNLDYAAKQFKGTPYFEEIFSGCVLLCVKLTNQEPYHAKKIADVAAPLLKTKKREDLFYPFSDFGKQTAEAELLYEFSAGLATPSGLKEYPFDHPHDLENAKRNYTFSVLAILSAFNQWKCAAAFVGTKAHLPPQSALPLFFGNDRQPVFVRAELTSSMRKACFFALSRQLKTLSQNKERMNRELSDIQAMLDAQGNSCETFIKTYSMSHGSLHAAYPRFLEDTPLCLQEAYEMINRQLESLRHHFDQTKKIVAYLHTSDQATVDADLGGKNYVDVMRFFNALPEELVGTFKTYLPDIMRTGIPPGQWIFMMKIESQIGRVRDQLHALLNPAFTSMNIHREVYVRATQLARAERSPAPIRSAPLALPPEMVTLPSPAPLEPDVIREVAFDELSAAAILPKERLAFAVVGPAYSNAEQLQFDLLSHLNFFLSEGSSNPPLDLMVMTTQCSRLLEQVLAALAGTTQRKRIQSHSHVGLFAETGLPFNPRLNTLLYGLNRLEIRARFVILLDYRTDFVLGEDLLRRAYQALTVEDPTLQRDVIRLITDTLLICHEVLGGKTLTPQILEGYLAGKKEVRYLPGLAPSPLVESIMRLDDCSFFGAGDLKANLLLLLQRIELEKARLYPQLTHLRLVNFELFVYTFLEQIAAYYLEQYDVVDYGHDIVKMLHESGRLDRLSATEIAFIKRAKAVCLAARYMEMREKRNIFQTAAVSAKKFGAARASGVEEGLRFVSERIQRDYRKMMDISIKLLT